MSPPSQELPPRRNRAGRLLALGAGSGLSAPAAVLAAAGALVVAGVVRSTLPVALFQADPEAQAEGTLLWGALGLLLGAALARALALAGAVAQSAASLRGQPVGVAEAVGRSAGTGLLWAIGAALAQLAFQLWVWTGLLATLGALLFAAPAASLLGAAGLALVLSVALLGGFVLSLWLELALVRAVVIGGGVARAAADATRLLLRRPGFVVLAWLVTALPALALSGFVQTLLGFSRGIGWVSAAASGIGLLLLALIDATATVARLGAFAAAELDAAGELPLPPPPVPRATLVDPGSIVQARAVGPPEPGAAG
jgi:hypothetical protein